MRALLVPLMVMMMAGPVAAGDPDDLLTGRSDGTYRLQYPVREGVYGDGSSRIITISGDGDRSEWWDDDLSNGPARVEVRLRDGKVRDVDTTIGGEWSTTRSGETDLGEVDPQIAASWLLDIAATARESVAEDALFGAVIARDAVVWPELLNIAKDRDRPDGVRQDALFWVASDAADEALGPLSEIVGADDESADLREHAVFVLSQLPEDKALPMLLDLARGHKHPEVQRAAFIWLAEFDDPAVLNLFEEILVSR
ncbi:HEAT repeat domain-containing protein [bacterium]|nr:HEAT repeat domain-containing protein [bacterium]